MLLGNKGTNYPIVIRKIITEDFFNIILLDWFAMNKETREAIVLYCKDDDDGKITATQQCTAVVIIPRENTGLQLNSCRLHISTIGNIDPSDITGFITECLQGDVDRLENPVTLSGCEKVEILCSMIPVIDMRGVV